MVRFVQVLNVLIMFSFLPLLKSVSYFIMMRVAITGMFTSYAIVIDPQI